MCMFSLSGKLVSEFNYKLLYWPLMQRAHRAPKRRNAKLLKRHIAPTQILYTRSCNAALECEISYPNVLVIYSTTAFQY